MADLCNLCKLLANPLRLEMLVRVHLAADGVNVGVLADELSQSGIGQSGVSQYLKQLDAAGVVRRVRAGRYVNYVRSNARSQRVREAVSAIVQRMKAGGGRDFAYIFSVMMNPFRARAVAAVAKAGAVSAVEICERLEHQSKYLRRDLQCAVDAGILSVDDSDTQTAVYRYVKPSDPLVARLVDLAT